MDHEKKSEPTVIRHGEKEAVRFVTPSGVTAIVATSTGAVVSVAHLSIPQSWRAIDAKAGDGGAAHSRLVC